MAWTLGITGDGVGITYTGLVVSFDAIPGKYFDSIMPLGLTFGYQENVVPGLDGANMGHLGFRERRITTRVIYVAVSREECLSQWASDESAMMGKALSLNAGGTSYPACYLDGTGTRITDGPFITENATAVMGVEIGFAQKRIE